MQSHRLDLCVAGGSLYACSIAAQAARQGQRVLMLVPGFSLGSDLSGTLRCQLVGTPGMSELSELLYSASVPSAEGADAFVLLGRMKKTLLNFVEAAGAEVLFGCRVTGAENDTLSDGLCVTYARKGGKDSIQSERLFWHADRTEGTGTIFSTLEYTALDVSSGTQTLAIGRDALELSIAANPQEHHAYVTFPICTGAIWDYRSWRSVREQAAKIAVQVATALAEQLPAFAGAIPCRQAQQLYLENNTEDTAIGSCLWSLRSLPFQLTGSALDEIHSRAAQAVRLLAKPCAPLAKPLVLPPQIDEDADVLVLGAGTLGVPAAAAAGSSGVRVLAVEAAAAPGGIGTLGGIRSYFWGNRTGYVDVIDQAYAQLSACILPNTPLSNEWNMQLRIWAFESLLRKSEVQLLTQARIIGVEKAGNRLTHALLDTPYGPLTVSAAVWIDATGDGDAAALAGIPYVIGDEESGNIQTSNQSEWSRAKGFGGINVDLTAHDPTDVREIDRCAKLAHRQGADYDFNDFAACRESRNFKGAYTYTLSDLFLQAIPGDVIIKSHTAYDQHSLQSSLAARLGFMPYHQALYSAYLPYRCCYSPLIDNLLFGGKCVSAERDAYPFLRMMPDIINQGYALGRAARYALTHRFRVRDIDMDWLHGELFRAQVLSPEDLELSPVCLNEIESQLTAGNYYAVLLAICYGEEAVPMLRDRLSQADGLPRLYTAMALACMGHADGAPLLESVLSELWLAQQTEVSDREGRPIGGIPNNPPSPYWLANALIIALGRLGDPQHIPLFVKILRGTQPGPTLPHVRLHWRRAHQYDRILSLCEAAFAHPHDDLAEPLAALLDMDGTGNHHVWDPAADAYANHPSALLELTIARAAYRCRRGTCADVLERYGQDVRKRLVIAAKCELERGI